MAGGEGQADGVARLGRTTGGGEDERAFVFDGRIPSRHGPRVVDVLEGLAEVLHPDEFGGLAPPGIFDPQPFR